MDHDGHSTPRPIGGGWALALDEGGIVRWACDRAHALFGANVRHRGVLLRDLVHGADAARVEDALSLVTHAARVEVTVRVAHRPHLLRLARLTAPSDRTAILVVAEATES